MNFFKNLMRLFYLKSSDLDAPMDAEQRALVEARRNDTKGNYDYDGVSFNGKETHMSGMKHSVTRSQSEQ